MAKLSKEARKHKAEYNTAYKKAVNRRVVLNLNRNTMADVIEQLEKQESKQGYIINLIREDMKRH